MFKKKLSLLMATITIGSVLLGGASTVSAALKRKHKTLSLALCKDGLEPKINKIGNWFELLDSWFDKDNTSLGGYNRYRY